MAHPTLEEVLRRVEDQAAMLRFLVDATALRDEAPEPRVLSGIANQFEDIAETMRRTRAALSVDALGEAIGPARKK